jgi:hypothetical protein
MTAAERYLACLYETAVYAALDVGQMRQALEVRGIRRSLFQGADNLTHVYQFGNYVACHPAAPAFTLQQIDAALDR